MFDGSELSMEENLKVSQEYAKKCVDLDIILEVEIGVVGGEEDGHDTSGVANDKLYTTPEDMVATYAALQPIGSFMLAATFGNVHGVYKPGNVKLNPSILKEGQAAVKAAHGTEDNPRPGLPRRFRFDQGRNPRDPGLRRDQNERRHRLPVRFQPSNRRTHVQKLRRLAEN